MKERYIHIIGNESWIYNCTWWTYG